MDWKRPETWLRRRSVWAVAAAVMFVAAGAIVGLRQGGPAPRHLQTAAGSSAGGPVAIRPSAGTTETRGALGAGSGGAAGGAGSQGVVAAPDVGGTAAAPPSAPPAPAPAAPSALPAGLGQARVVRTAQLQLEVRRGSVQRAFDRLSGLAAANGGFVSSSSTSSGDASSPATGDLDLRVPADHFDATLRAVGELGRTRQEHLQGDDVSGQLVDLDARIKSLQSEEDTLRTIVGQAKTVGELLQVQPQLFDVRQQIEQLQAQKAHLDDATAMSTVHVSLFEPGATPTKPPEPQPRTGLAHSLSRAVHGAGLVVGGMVVVAGYLVPFIALGLVAWGAWHVRRRRPAAPPAEA